LEHVLARLTSERGEIRDFRFAEGLQPVRRESVDIAGEDEARARDVRAGPETIEPTRSDLLQGKPALEARDEGTDSERSIHAVSIFLLRVLVVRLSWRVCASRRLIAKPSAGPKNRALPSATMGRRRGA